MDTNEGQFSALQELSETATWLDENGFRDPDIRREYKSSGTQTEAAAEAKYAAELKEFGKGDKKFADAVRILQGYNQKLEAKLNREDPKSSEMFHMEDLDLEDLNTVCTWVATKSLTTQFDALKDKIKREGVQKALGQDLVVLENSSSTMIRNLETLKRRRQTSVRKIGRLAPVNEMDGEDTSTDWEQFEAENEIELLKGQVSVLEEVLKSLGKNAREGECHSVDACGGHADARSKLNGREKGKQQGGHISRQKVLRKYIAGLSISRITSEWLCTKTVKIVCGLFMPFILSAMRSTQL